MKFDRELVGIFIAGLNQTYGKSYSNPIFPEDQNRNTKEVEAIFTDDEGCRLAIEHTLIQPFLGERGDGFGAFEKVFGPLEKDLSLALPEYNISIAVPAFAVPNGEKWGAVAAKVKDWFIRERSNFPNASKQMISGLSFPLTLRVWKYYTPGRAGKVTISRTELPDTFQEVVKIALLEKVPKLVKSAADERVLLFEQNVPIPDIVTVEEAIEKNSLGCPDFEKIDEIWVVDSVAWRSEGVLFFERTFADDGGRRERFTYRKSEVETGTT